MGKGDFQAQPAVVVIFGASGDLTQRKLIPALYTLACEGHLHPQTHVLGIARSPLNDEIFQQRLYTGVVDYARLQPGICTLWDNLADRYTYMQGGYDDPGTYQELNDRLARFDAEKGTAGNHLFYLATPPMLYPVIVNQLGQAGLNQSSGWTRIIIEKPFGHDFDSAQSLNQQIHDVFEEPQVYRIDHYLGKETVQNILSFRFANAIFEPLWNRNYVDHVQVTVAENMSVEKRAGYYDKAGVLRDMFQNHLLQLLTLVAMEPPAAFNAHMLRDEKVKVLHAIRPPQAEDCVYGQYERYHQAAGVAPDSNTPTYAALRLHIDNWRWKDVPFYLRSGKCLPAKTTVITLVFKKIPHLLFEESGNLPPNRLSLCIQPDEGIHLQFATKIPGAGMSTTPVDMTFKYAKEEFSVQGLPEAYERLLLDAIQGDASLFARADEIETAWKLIDPLIDWAAPIPYTPGTWGPPEADALLALEGRTWYAGCGSQAS